jgi:3-oxoacyl-[acyl-carrier protein] reductase
LEKFLSAFSEPIDVLVNNAGENPISNLADLELSTWDRVLQTNLTSPLMLVRHFAPLMARQGFGRIVNISSAYSSKARIGRSMYSASKAALDSLTRSAAVEFAGQGILVNSVCPGFIDTELTRKNNNPETIQKLLSRVPAGRLGTQDEIAEVVAWLGSPQNSYTSGQCIHVDGAFSIT